MNPTPADPTDTGATDNSAPTAAPESPTPEANAPEMPTPTDPTDTDTTDNSAPESPTPEANASELPTQSVLRVDTLYKSYGKKQVVSGVSFDISQGSIIGFLGPNGAGKTTIFHMLVGFITSDHGHIYLDDTEITLKPMFRRARLGITYLPQEPSVFRHLSVAQNIMAALESRKDINHAQRKAILETLLEQFDIERLRSQKTNTLSGGERRRTEIARALAVDPKFLLLDEPFTGIDPIAVHDIKAIVRSLSQKGIGVLITDHNARDTLDIIDSAYIIKDGVIVASGSRTKLLQDRAARQAYFGNLFDD